MSNHSNTNYFASNKNIHFQFNADEQFLPIYQLADESNKKITHLDLFAEKFLKKYTLGDVYEYLIGQFAAGSGEKAVKFFMPQQIYTILSEIVTLDSQLPSTGKKSNWIKCCILLLVWVHWTVKAI